MKKQACVVGSGASSYALINSLVKSRKFKKIHLITTGSFQDIFELNLQKSKSIQNNKAMFSVVPEKLLFGSDKIYQRSDKINFKINNFELKTSHHFSGLVNVWGANVSFPSYADTALFKDYKSYKKYFSKVASLLSLSGNFQWDQNSKNITVSEFKEFRSERANVFNKLASKMTCNNFRAGSSVLAVKSKGKLRCKPCGKCMEGCERGAIFNLYREYKLFLEKHKNIINLIDNTKVKKINFIDGKFKINCNSITLNKIDKCFLAAGPLDNGLILLNSNIIKKKEIYIKDSTKYYFIAFRPKSVKVNEEQDIGALSESFIQMDSDYGTLHAQIYPSSSLLNIIFNKVHFLSFLKKLNISNYFSIGMLYLPSTISDEFSLKLDSHEMPILNSHIQHRLIRSFYLMKFLINSYIKLSKFGFFLLPFFKKCPVGNSQHFGSFDDLSQKDLPNGLFLADASGLKVVPGTPTTALVMAYAMSLGEFND